MRVLGADIGQARDPTALALVEGFDVLHLERLPLGTPYPEVAKRISTVAAAAGDPLVAIDAGGVGRAVADLLREQGCWVLPVTSTGGKLVRRSTDTVSVPKEMLLGLLVAAVEQGRLRVARGCPAAAELLAELAAYRKRRDRRGRVRIEARGPGHHGDLAVAVALGLLAQGLQRARKVSAPRNQKLKFA
jgi:hypothetical protein